MGMRALVPAAIAALRRVAFSRVLIARIGLALVAGSLAFGVAAAQGNPLAGHWRAVLNINGRPIQFDLVVQPNMVFSQTQRTAGLMTLQRGEIRQAGPDTLAFEVEDWEPKSMAQYSSGPLSVSPYWHQVPMGRPPGGLYRYRLDGPDSLTMHDVNMGGNITYRRVE